MESNHEKSHKTGMAEGSNRSIRTDLVIGRSCKLNYSQGAFALIGLILSGVFFLIAIQWAVKNTHMRRSSAWLMGLSITAFFQFADFLYVAAELYVQWPILYRAVDPIVVLLPLCAYGHMRELQGDNIFSSRKRALVYLSPAFIVLGLDFHLWSMPLDQQLEMILASREDERNWQSWAPQGNVYLSFVGGLCLFYWYLQRKKGYDGKSQQVTAWVNKIQLFLIMTVFAIASRIIALEGFNYQFSMAYTLSLFAVYFLYSVLGFTVLPQHSASSEDSDKKSGQDVLTEVTEHKEKRKTEINEENQPETPQQIPENGPLKDMFKLLETSLKGGAFKDNDLSLGSLARSCDLTNHQASAAINQYSGCNFYEWVNQYRIAAAQAALESSSLPVSTICYDVGFNSKSTFYTAFKKISGCTPTEFRKSLQGRNTEPA